MLRHTTHLALGTALLGAAATLAPAAHAERIGFNLSIGGPGYAVSVGNAPYWGGRHFRGPYRYDRPHWRPAYVAQPLVYAPRVVYVAPPRVVYRLPYVRYPVVRGPYYDY